MDLGFTQDQTLLLETLEHWAADHLEIPAAARDAAFLATPPSSRRATSDGDRI